MLCLKSLMTINGREGHEILFKAEVKVSYGIVIRFQDSIFHQFYDIFSTKHVMVGESGSLHRF